MSYSIVKLAQGKPLIETLALATHYVLHQSEWDNSFHIVIGVWIVAFGSIATFGYVAETNTKSLGVAIQLAAKTASLYFAILIVSILLHRGVFHRLRKIPGPFFARFSKSYGVFVGVLLLLLFFH